MIFVLRLQDESCGMAVLLEASKRFISGGQKTEPPSLKLRTAEQRAARTKTVDSRSSDRWRDGQPNNIFY